MKFLLTPTHVCVAGRFPHWSTQHHNLGSVSAPGITPSLLLSICQDFEPGAVFHTDRLDKVSVMCARDDPSFEVLEETALVSSKT